TRRGTYTVRLLRRLLAKLGHLPVRIVLPDGEEVALPDVQPVGTIEILDKRIIWPLVFDPLFRFGEAYSRGQIEVHGNMADCLTEIYRFMNQNGKEWWGQRIWNTLRRPRGNSLLNSKDNIHHHYNIGNDFFRLWLDENMVYTCAYFSRPEYTLEQAQAAKMDHVCRKLRLQPGMEVVEAGCGWGALALHMAKHYGVRVRACNISREQIAFARETARRSGLSDQVEFVEDDWRNLRGQYDAFVSVGMLEHVGVRNYRLLGQTIRSCLKPDGLGLIHTIGQNVPRPLGSWIERRIFPGAYPPTLGQMMDILEPEDFSVLDVENLRLHYAETLRHWLQRFDDVEDEIRSQFDERFVRMWRMYLNGSIAGFASGCMQLFQVVFAHGACNRVPRTREHLYDSAFSAVCQTGQAAALR
ncbi:MAG: class I SAM-dependent methyltransferase, partial [Pirellulaceae bacterium]